MNAQRLDALYKKIFPFLAIQEEHYLIQSIEEQALFLCRKSTIIRRYDASTSGFGVGIRDNSYKTPPGIHRIREKIGAGAPAGRIFRERKDTGTDWDGKSTEDNLILTRIMRLEGLEDGINKGPGVDSYERFIYIHGTNREDLVGTPLSHGCIVLRNRDVVELFDRVSVGTVISIDPPPVAVGATLCRNVHFAGIFGTGMSALAQYLRFQGVSVSGSDRLFSDDTVSLQQSLEKLGCHIVSQDGSGISAVTDAVCVSTAIEASNPDIAEAVNRGVPVIHRSDLLASLIAAKKTIAVAGTSGKSTVTAMVFEFLTACGASPSLISGAPLRRLEREGHIGNAFSGGSELLVVEADESDGTVVKYSPDTTVILNISKDHKSIDEIKLLFETVCAHSRWVAVNADDSVLATFPAQETFGLADDASWRPDFKEVLPTSVKLVRDGIEYHLPLPGNHNLENLCAALCVCGHFGCDGPKLARAVAGFQGLARRFAITRTTRDIWVVDDFAHNPAKISAAVRAARGLSGRVIAVYQPHGFGPTRFLKDEYTSTFRTIFGKEDTLYLLPIYYAGGTAQKDISSEDIINGLGTVSFRAEAIKNREELLISLHKIAEPGDCVLVMGARDPSLASLTKTIEKLFGNTGLES